MCLLQTHVNHIACFDRLQFYIPCSCSWTIQIPQVHQLKELHGWLGPWVVNSFPLDAPLWTNILILSMLCSLKNYYLFAWLVSDGNKISFQRCPVPLLNNSQDGDIVIAVENENDFELFDSNALCILLNWFILFHPYKPAVASLLKPTSDLLWWATYTYINQNLAERNPACVCYY